MSYRIDITGAHAYEGDHVLAYYDDGSPYSRSTGWFVEAEGTDAPPTPRGNYAPPHGTLYTYSQGFDSRADAERLAANVTGSINPSLWDVAARQLRYGDPGAEEVAMALEREEEAWGPPAYAVLG